MDLALAIWRINPQAEYRLNDSANPTEIVEWRGPGPEPTQAELEDSWAWCQEHMVDGVFYDPDDPQVQRTLELLYYRDNWGKLKPKEKWNALNDTLHFLLPPE